MSGICGLLCSVVVAIPILKIIVTHGNPWMYLGLVVLLVALWLLAEARTKADAVYQEQLLKEPEELFKRGLPFY